MAENVSLHLVHSLYLAVSDVRMNAEDKVEKVVPKLDAVIDFGFNNFW